MKRHPPKTMLCHLHGNRPVIRTIAHPAGNHPPKTPIAPEMVAVQFILDCGCSRWRGCSRAVIGSNLRFILEGLNPRDEIVSNWPKVQEGE